MFEKRVWFFILGALVAGILIGRSSAPESIESIKKILSLTEENSYLNKKLTESLNRESESQKSKTITNITHPDGKTFSRIRYNENKKTSTVKETELTVESVIEKSQKTDTEEKTKTVNRRGAIVSFHALIPISFSSITTVYGATFTAPLGGPFYWGGSLFTDPRIGVHLGFGF